MNALALGVIADDLTGGAAIAGEISRSGVAVEVATLEVADQICGQAAVVETGSRYVSPELAAQRTIDALEVLRRQGAEVIMKKIDSTLKGNVATDLAAFVREATGIVLIAPACPEVGLSLVGGVQNRAGVTGLDVRELLASALGEAPTLLSLDTIRAGDGATRHVLAGSRASAVLADGVEEEDLRIVARAARAAGVVEFAGTYGLGAALGTALGWPDAERSPDAPLVVPETERTLVIAGSANPVSAEQVRRLAAAGAEEIVIDVPRLLRDLDAESARVAAAVRATTSALVVVHSGAGISGAEVTAHRDRERWSERELAERIAPPLVDAVRAFAGSGVYFVGGETTGAICEQLGWTRFHVLDEVAGAVPIAVPLTGEVPYVLMKPGAFGPPDGLIETVGRLYTSPRAQTA